MFYIEFKKKRKQNKSKKRPYVVWNNRENQTVVLLLAKFADQDREQNDVLSELSREYLIKDLLSIYPTPPTLERRSIQLMVSPFIKESLGEQLNSYLIVKPILFSQVTVWSQPQAEHISMDDMLHINKFIGELP